MKIACLVLALALTVLQVVAVKLKRTRIEIHDYLPKQNLRITLPSNDTFSSVFSVPSYIVQKQAKNNRIRLLFVAGLEGTGHHGIYAAMGPCFETGICRNATLVTKALFYRNESSNSSHGLFGMADIDNALHQLRHVLKAMNDVKKYNASSLFVIGLDTLDGAGMLSYPNYNDDRYKVFEHPDLVTLCAAAEHVGVDMRILVLQRSAEDVLASTINRGFGHGIQPRVAIENAAQLHSQLVQLDPGFVMCLSYEKMDEILDKRSPQLRHFLHPSIDFTLFARMWSHIRPVVRNKTQLNISSYHVARLQKEFMAIERWCLRHKRFV